MFCARASLSTCSIVNILPYDIVLFATSEVDLHFVLNILEIWREEWRLEVNLSKTNFLM